MIGLTESGIAQYVDTYHAALEDDDPCEDCGEVECTCDLWDCVDCRKLEKDCRCNAEEQQEAA